MIGLWDTLTFRVREIGNYRKTEEKCKFDVPEAKSRKIF